MPLFGHRNTAATAPAHNPPPVTSTSPQRSRGLFGRRRSSSDYESGTYANGTHANGTSPQRRGLLSRHNDEDPSIMTARERVLGAERAEKEADRALMMARQAVREARDHVKMLEREAAEQARLAKIKQGQAKSISKRAKPLGRHGHI
ncbi:hypothetical protein EJ06DRAFT_534042 [Trichodelitschia bisporula]|uniref:Uncharacterized protein n=1 Tax=Trichodelitschia bisporula TaxID=703511 RepID=A0A6G1HJR7_9PEZI|nr:hypothetical protein EJ06DRAFT_534042 [Trichodelitschia bisporula]